MGHFQVVFCVAFSGVVKQLQLSINAALIGK